MVVYSRSCKSLVYAIWHEFLTRNEIIIFLVIRQNFYLPNISTSKANVQLATVLSMLYLSQCQFISIFPGQNSCYKALHLFLYFFEFQQIYQLKKIQQLVAISQALSDKERS